MGGLGIFSWCVKWHLQFPCFGICICRILEQQLSKASNVNFSGVTCCQVWQAFVQESIRTVASAYGTDLTLCDGLAIDEVTKEAFLFLGQDGIILAAKDHHCSDCTHPYKHTSDLNASDDPTETLEGNNISTPQSLRQSSSDEAQRMEVDDSAAQDVTMVVLDGIVFGPTHGAYDNCTADLANARGGVFCALHEQEHEARCHVKGCENQKVQGTNACQVYQKIWKRYLSNHTCKQLSGCYPGLVKIYHSSLLKTQMHNLMMNQQPVCSMQPTLCHTDSTVLKPYVHHVELSLHGKNLQIQNHLPILCAFWRQSIQQKNHVQITYALIKPA